MSIYQKVKSSKTSIKDFSKHIASYTGNEWDDAYYQRIRDIIKGERDSATELEKEAMDWWEYTLSNPFKASECTFKMIQSKRAFDQLWKYLRTGFYNHQDVKRLMRRLKSYIPDRDDLQK